MRRNLVYIGSQSRIQEAKQNLERLRAKPLKGPDKFPEALLLKHPGVYPLELEIHMREAGDNITELLKVIDIDILVYDERTSPLKAIEAFQKYNREIQAFSESWGPDFHFPLKRAVAILDETPDAAHRAFILGRSHVQDVIVDPHSLAKILKWVAKILAVESRKNLHSKAGMALSGGALEGFLYQLGAAHALNIALGEHNLEDLDIYSGVSSGSILASMIANRVPLIEMIRAVYGTSKILPPLKSSSVFDLATKEIVARIFDSSSLKDKLDPTKWIANFIKGVPTGFFKGEALKKFFETVIEAFPGTTNEFSELKSRLFIGATDQDQLSHEVFGEKDKEITSISEAVRASCALPPFYTPVRIGNRRFVDGQITRTSNLELVVEKGCQLVFVIDPLRPFASQVPGTVEKEGGIFALIQTVKALVYSRFQTTLTHLTERYPDVDFIVLQPDENITRIMSGSPMRYKIRCEIIELAYRATLKRLIERYEVYTSKLSKHGFNLKSLESLKKLERSPLDI